MLTDVVITLTNGSSERDIVFEVYSSDIAQHWARLANRYRIKESTRFTNWPNSIKDNTYYVSKLNEKIDIVNDYHQQLINLRMSNTATQKTMNKLHKHFEELRGDRDASTDWFHSAPKYVQDAVEEFNILIHEYESFVRNAKSLYKHTNATIVCTFENSKRFAIQDKDYDKFTFCWNFGELYLNYCEVGKPLLDVFKDNDSIVGNNNIKPQRHYNADFMIKFGPSTPKPYYWLRRFVFHVWCALHPVAKHIPKNKLSAGMIPVAKFNFDKSNFSNCTQKEVVHTLKEFNKVKHVRCI